MKNYIKATFILFILITFLMMGCGKETESLSVTYPSVDDQQMANLSPVELQMRDSIGQVLADKKYYPNLLAISANKDYSQFDVTFQSTDINIYETTLRMSLYIAGNKYQLDQGVNDDSLFTVVNYINESTGEIFSTGDSKSVTSDTQP